MTFAAIDYNKFVTWLADHNAAFQAQEKIAFQDQGNRQHALNDFVTYLCDKARDEGAIALPLPEVEI